MFGKNLDTLLRERRISKKEVSELINVHRVTLDDYLNERTFMPSDKIEKIAEFLHVPVGDIFDGTWNNNSNNVQKQLEIMQKQIEELYNKFSKQEQI